MPELIITADDYGLSERYDAGIVEAARAGAVDAVSAFVTRGPGAPEQLLGSGVEVGLHLDLGAGHRAPRAGAGDRERAAAELERQWVRFRDVFGREPAHLDGHHHCHAREGLGVVVSDFAVSHGLPVRSIGSRHRRLLRCRGVRTPDLLVGRLNEDEPLPPPELDPGAAGEGPALPDPSVVEWMVHPGHPDPGAGSSYDAGRGQDLALLMGWSPPPGVRRTTHAQAALRPAERWPGPPCA